MKNTIASFIIICLSLIGFTSCTKQDINPSGNNNNGYGQNYSEALASINGVQMIEFYDGAQYPDVGNVTKTFHIKVYAKPVPVIDINADLTITHYKAGGSLVSQTTYSKINLPNALLEVTLPNGTAKGKYIIALTLNGKSTGFHKQFNAVINYK